MGLIREWVFVLSAQLTEPDYRLTLVHKIDE